MSWRSRGDVSRRSGRSPETSGQGHQGPGPRVFWRPEPCLHQRQPTQTPPVLIQSRGIRVTPR
jgi:hypothetical protein